MLLFGGAVRVQHGSGSISIGDWIQLRGTPRIGVLINQLRYVSIEGLEYSLTELL